MMKHVVRRMDTVETEMYIDICVSVWSHDDEARCKEDGHCRNRDVY
jgi:hypothetical protein